MISFDGSSSAPGAALEARGKEEEQARGKEEEQGETAFDPAEGLRKRGFAVVSHMLIELRLDDLQAEFRETVGNFPEYSRAQLPFVLGGFSALGNPASFHNPFVRKIRQWCMAIVVQDLFRGLVHSDPSLRDHKIEQVIDRMLYRERGKTPVAETWHRDITPVTVAGDLVFGGWINLNSEPQYFSCVPGTHLEPRPAGAGTGFSQIPKEQHAAYKKRARLVAIPPGGILVFYEHLVHEVVARKYPVDMMRLFLGWRLTTDNRSIVTALSQLPEARKIPGQPDHVLRPLDELLEAQAVIPLKSGQGSPMVSKLHTTQFIESHWVPFSQNFLPAVKVWHEIKSKSAQKYGQRFLVVPRFMKSLREYGFQLFDAYSQNEQLMYKPSLGVRVLMPGREHLFQDVHL